MALIQNVQSFCRKYKQSCDTAEVYLLMRRALESISVHNFYEHMINKDLNFVKANITFLGKPIMRNGLFTPEQIKDLNDIGSEIKFNP